jgi:hypothetical protein
MNKIIGEFFGTTGNIPKSSGLQVVGEALKGAANLIPSY